MRKYVAGAILLSLMSSFASAERIRICVENLSPSDGFYLAPMWFGMHSGSFDIFNVGGVASPALEELAETGSSATLSSDFAATGGQDGLISDPAGIAGVIDPGNVAFEEITVLSPSVHRYFSFASMIIPSNDAFTANGNPIGWEIFDAAGNFTGPVTITLTPAMVYDAGTELNDGLGAPFSTNGGTSTDTNDRITKRSDLTTFVGTSTESGSTIGATLDNPFAQITIKLVPEPSSLSLLSLAGLGLLSWRRRRNR